MRHSTRCRRVAIAYQIFAVWESGAVPAQLRSLAIEDANGSR